MEDSYKEYIKHCEKRIQEVLDDEREYSDWTQICFSMKDAIQCATYVWGISSNEEIHKMACFFREMILKEMINIKTFDITFEKKGS